MTSIEGKPITMSVLATPEPFPTPRDYFAAKAMQALISAHANDTCGVYAANPTHWATKEAYEFADAMLEARK